MRGTSVVWARCVPGLLVSAALCAAGAHAQTYPAKTIRLIVPLAAGGPSDIMARALALKLTEVLKQSVVVDNRAGASGTIGTDLAAKSPPDGYTILLVSTAVAINPSLFKKLPYDTLRDLQAVSLLAEAPYLLTVHPSLPVKTVKQLIALAKARPGELNHASGGQGTGPHLGMELFAMMTGIKIVHIVYKGGGPAMNDFLAGQTQVFLSNMVQAYPQVKGGRMRALAVSKDKRSPVVPELPTIAESGVPGFNEGGQHGILTPAGVPREVLAVMHEGIVKAMHSAEVKKRLETEGAGVVASTPAEYDAIIRRDMAKWAKVIQAAGIRVD